MKTLILKIVDLFNLYALFNSHTKNTATIFMLHAIAKAGDVKGHGLSPELIDRFLAYLKKHNYQVLSLEQYVQALLKHESVYKTVVFTVDDGYRDFYLNAYPVFKKYNYSATIFLTSDFIDRKLFFWWDQIEYCLTNTTKKTLQLPGLPVAKLPLTTSSERTQAITEVTRYCKTLANEAKLLLLDELTSLLEVDLTGQPAGRYEPLLWSEIKEMADNAIDFHPHTQTHPIMSKLTAEMKRTEVTQAKERIEAELNNNASIFCYPNGQWEDFDEEVIDELKIAGYTAAVTGVEGFDLTTNETDIFRLRRWPIPYDETRFRQYVCGLEKFKQSTLGRG